MKAQRKSLFVLLFTLIVFISLSKAVVSADDPTSLKGAVDEIKKMMQSGQPKQDIAGRVTEIADNRIVNTNSGERMSIFSNWFIAFRNSTADESFARWRDNDNGAEEQYDKVAQWVWDSKYGQCAENSALTYYILKEAGAKNVRIMKTPTHRFCVWGMDEEADPNKKESWTKDVFVPDSWSGRTTSGEDAYYDEYLSNGGKSEIDDVTDIYHRGEKARCGTPAGNCCVKLPTCRNSPLLVCQNNICAVCGKSKNQPCCQGNKCAGGLKCESGKCIDKESKNDTAAQTGELKGDRSGCPTSVPADAGFIGGTYSTAYFEKFYPKNNQTKIIGPYRIWQDQKKTKKSLFECYNLDGKKDGPSTTWNADGNIYLEGSYKDDKKEGLWKKYYSGHINEEANYKNGLLNGPYKSYLTSGSYNLNSEGSYSAGKEQGYWKYYTPSGWLSEEREYSAGKSTGNYITYYEAGKKDTESKGSMINGKFTGTTISWMLGGIKCNYENGKTVGECVYVK